MRANYVDYRRRPNLRPDLRACSSLSAVLSLTNSRSYSAMDIRIPATILPVLVEVSTPSCKDRTEPSASWRVRPWFHVFLLHEGGSGWLVRVLACHAEFAQSPVHVGG